jgi:GH15 family glucan-1,4-alpha-glucosidase
MASRIEDYGLVGDTRTAALVSKSGSIDWLCAPHFDSDACFASLLGYDEHGRWSLRPSTRVRETHQRYEGDTLILVTEFACDGGVVRLIDFMPANEGRCDVIRLVEGVEGEVPIEMELVPRFGYGRNAPWIRPNGDGVTMTAGPDSLVLRSNVPLSLSNGHVGAQRTVKKGDRFAFQLSWYASHLATPAPLDVDKARKETEAWWSNWAKRCRYRGRYRDAVMRSLLTLKALSFSPTGAIVAAPTAALPEEIGGVRNWDYRYCWIRDASLTLDALMFGGYIEEAGAFREWLLRTVAGDPRELQIMYDIHGGRRLQEMEVGWLPGYEGSHPVHIGNAASEQFQLDIYGELLSAMYLGRKMGLAAAAETWEPARQLMQHLQVVWQQPDDGIWEVRGGRRHFTHSKLMAWTAVDRAVRLVEEFKAGGDVARAMLPHLHTLRERIREEILHRGFNPRVGAFTQYYGGTTLDASVLLIPHVGFLPGTDPRVKSTVARIEKGLVRDGFVQRYATEHGLDGLPGSEGAFLACSFWLADNYAFAGRIDEAEALYDRLLGLRNHLGLLAEEWEPSLQRQVGNFPQGFSHLALISTARVLEDPETKRKRPATEPARHVN